MLTPDLCWRRYQSLLSGTVNHAGFRQWGIARRLYDDARKWQDDHFAGVEDELRDRHGRLMRDEPFVTAQKAGLAEWKARRRPCKPRWDEWQ